MRLNLFVAAVLVAAAACSPQASPPPSVAPADPPPVEARSFPVEWDAARLRLEGHAMRCQSLEPAPQQTIRCVADDRDAPEPAYLVVDLVSQDGGFVWLVEATVDRSGADEPDLTGFEGFYAGTVLGTVVNPVPPAVGAWLREHVTTTGSIDADGLMLEMRASPTRTTLRIWQEP